jgi:hypothetical protein
VEISFFERYYLWENLEFVTDKRVGDDLSMLIAVGTVLHRVFTFDQSLSTTVIGGIMLTALMTLFSIWHCVKDEMVMHSVLFGAFYPRSFDF